MTASTLVLSCCLLAQVPADGFRPEADAGALLPQATEVQPLERAGDPTGPPTGPPSTLPAVVQPNAEAEATGGGSPKPPRQLQPNASAIPVQKPRDSSAAEALLRDALSPPREGALAGRELTMQECLTSSAPLQAERLERVQAYWLLSRAIADYHFAVSEQKQLDRAAIAGGTSQTGLSAARAAATARVADAKLAAIEAQHVLAERLLLPVDDPLPVPTDPMLVGPYRTGYPQIFTTQPVTTAQRREARRIHDTLPLRVEAIASRTSVVRAAEAWDTQATSDFQQGKINEAVLLEGHEKLRTERRAFLGAVLDHNLAIVQYATIVAPQGAPPVSLLPMLIKQPEARAALPSLSPEGWRAAGAGVTTGSVELPQPSSPSGVVPASAEEPLVELPREADRGTPSTAQDSGGELRSVVVPRRRQ